MLNELVVFLVCVFLFVLMVIGILIENWAVAGFAALSITLLVWDLLKDGPE